MQPGYAFVSTFFHLSLMVGGNDENVLMDHGFQFPLSRLSDSLISCCHMKWDRETWWMHWYSARGLLPAGPKEHRSATLASFFFLGQTVGLMPDCGSVFVASEVTTQMAGPLKPLTGVLSRSVVKAALFDLPLLTFEIRAPFAKSRAVPRIMGDLQADARVVISNFDWMLNVNNGS